MKKKNDEIKSLETTLNIWKIIFHDNFLYTHSV